MSEAHVNPPRTMIRRLYRKLFPSRMQPAACRMKGARTLGSAERLAVQHRVKEIGPWFHNYEIAGGVWTNAEGQSPGPAYPAWRWQFVQKLLPDISGKSCLDVGCSSGFFSLKVKELGAAHVTGVDSGEQPRAIEQARFAAQLLGYDVEFQSLSAYALHQLGRQFDVVLFMGVLYHLRHPLLALEAVRSVCKESMIVQTITTAHKRKAAELVGKMTESVGLHSPLLTDHRFPAMRFVEGALDGDVTCWFIPNVQAVNAMLRSCGFIPERTVYPTEREVIIRSVVR